MKIRATSSEAPKRKMALFMHSRPASEGPLHSVRAVQCLKSWLDPDTDVRYTLIAAPALEMVEWAWPDDEIVELFGSVERWMSVDDIRFTSDVTQTDVEASGGSLRLPVLRYLRDASTRCGTPSRRR